MVPFRKKLSGAQYRKRKHEQNSALKKSAQALRKYVIAKLV